MLNRTRAFKGIVYPINNLKRGVHEVIGHKMKCDTDNLTTIFCMSSDAYECLKSPSHGKQAHSILFSFCLHVFPQISKKIDLMEGQDERRAFSDD